MTAPVRGFTLAGRPLDVLPYITQVGADAVALTGLCGLPGSGHILYGESQPSVRVKRGLEVTGLLDLGQLLPVLLGG